MYMKNVEDKPKEKTIHVRFSEEEFQKIITIADENFSGSISAFIRFIVQNYSKRKRITLSPGT